MSTRVVPTFLLKGVDPRKLLEDYRAGIFSKPRSNASDIHIVTKPNMLAPSYSSNRSERIYAIRDRHNNNIIIASSNYTNWKITSATADRTLPEGGRCALCRQDIKGTPVGYPIDYQESVHVTPDGVTHIFYQFLIENTFCDFECCLAFIQSHLMFSYSPLYLNAELHLRTMYRLVYPNHPPLLPAKDPLLLDCNGGSLELKEWKDRSHAYLKSDRVLVAPARVEHIQHLK